MPQPSVIRKKVLLLGDSGTGKTHLLRAHNGSTSYKAHIPTVLQTTILKVKPTEDGKQVELAIWEVGGAAGDQNLLRLAAADADIAAICYAADDRPSLQNSVRMWASLVRNIQPNLPLFLIGCKSDVKSDKVRIYKKKAPQITKVQQYMYGEKRPMYSPSSESSGTGNESAEDQSSKFISSRRGANEARKIEAGFKECSAESTSSVRSVFRRIAASVL